MYDLADQLPCRAAVTASAHHECQSVRRLPGQDLERATADHRLLHIHLWAGSPPMCHSFGQEPTALVEGRMFVQNTQEWRMPRVQHPQCGPAP
ncbi:hypothetical protein OG288_00515 [Streptomyces tauricus]|uniref:Uncharacterized protein n=1 Tax=Streptomyces tauricus TaxID=68274 RepID=A0ABZ1J5N4_9ACTN|nr:hypothetical protein [Streptomyces tauricus]